MSQSALDHNQSPLHVALIMDGNGRWATSKGLPRFVGHQAGAVALRSIVQAAPDMNVGTLTVYAFSSDNWQRPLGEVSALMQLFQTYLQLEVQRCLSNGVRLSVIGRRDRLSPGLQEIIEKTERKTQGGQRLHLRLAIDYSAREMLVRAAREVKDDAEITQASLQAALQQVSGAAAKDVDLLIRTGGEQRLSDFLLWECAYAELFFSPIKWPDFGPEQLQDIVRQYYDRERRFGGLPVVAAH